MNRLAVRADGLPAWRSLTDMVMVSTDAARYNDAIARLAQTLTEQGSGVFVTANRPTPILKAHLTEAGVDTSRMFYVDCVSAMTGVVPPSEKGVAYLESPTMLEKAAMRAEQVLRRTGGSFVIVDSLSTLAVYNGVEAVAELVHTLITRLRLQGCGAALVIVDKQAPPDLPEAIQPLCDAEVQL